MFETSSRRSHEWLDIRSSAWRICLALGFLGLVVLALVPFEPAAHNIVYLVLGCSFTAAILFGIRLHHPFYPLPWYALFTGQTMLLLGGALRYELILPSGTLPPALVDGVILTAHLAVAAALALIVHRCIKGSELSTVLDAAIIAAALGTLAYICLAGLYPDSSMTVADRLISTIDALYLAAFAWLVLISGFRQASLYLLGGGLLLVLVCDALYMSAPAGAYYTGRLVEYGWLLTYVLWGACVLHPSTKTLNNIGTVPSSHFARRNADLLAATALFVPAILTIQYLRGEPIGIPVVVGSSLALFLLLRARLNGLAQTTASTTDEVKQATEREKTLGKSAAALVAATDRSGVYAAALDAVQALLKSARVTSSVSIALGDRKEMTVVAATGPGAREGASLLSSDLPVTVRGALLQQRCLAIKRSMCPWFSGTTKAESLTGEYFFIPLVVRNEFKGIVLISTDVALDEGIQRGLVSLGAQVAHALQRTEFTEKLQKQHSEERFESLTRNTSDVITVAETDGTVRYASPSHEQVLGYKPEDVVGKDTFEFIHPEDLERVSESFKHIVEASATGSQLEFRVRHANGTWRYMETTVTNMLEDPNVCGLVVDSRDVTEHKRTQEKLSYQALHDHLTGLPNRSCLMQRLQDALSKKASHQTENSVAVLFLDLNRFKIVNDSLGHDVGDRLLVAVSKRLKACVRPTDTVARLGGDEFVVLLEDVESMSQVIYAAERIVKLFDTAFELGDQEVHTGVSIGIAMNYAERALPSDLLRDADIAMYRAKANSESSYEVFATDMGGNAQQRFERESDIRKAIARKEFVVYYQPKIDLASGRLHGFEALVRWDHPTRGLIPPGEFIPLAEDSGLIVPIGQWVLEESCRQAKKWQDHYGADAPAVGVNLSARQFQHPKLAEVVAAVLEETGLEPGTLLLEVTESAMMDNAEITNVTLEELKTLGVRIAIDDFGTGYSSLSYLQKFPLDMLKIDRSFVNEIGQNSKNIAIIEAVSTLGRALEMQVLAEGVETAEQAAWLQEIGCELGQGYYFSRPVPQGTADQLIVEHQSLVAKR